MTAVQPTETVTEDEFDKVFNVNVKSIYHSAQIIVPVMQKYGNGGSFVNIASTAGIRPRPGLVWYNASKAAVINATKAMAVEYAKDKIRFNSICPVVGLGTGLYACSLERRKSTCADTRLQVGPLPWQAGERENVHGDRAAGTWLLPRRRRQCLCFPGERRVGVLDRN